MFVALREAGDQRGATEPRLYERAQRAGAFAVDHAHAQQIAALAFLQLVIEQIARFVRTERVEVQFARDRELHGLVGCIAGHARHAWRGRKSGDKKPALCRAGFCTHTLTDLQS